MEKIPQLTTRVVFPSWPWVACSVWGAASVHHGVHSACCTQGNQAPGHWLSISPVADLYSRQHFYTRARQNSKKMGGPWGLGKGREVVDVAVEGQRGILDGSVLFIFVLDQPFQLRCYCVSVCTVCIICMQLLLPTLHPLFQTFNNSYSGFEDPVYFLLQHTRGNMQHLSPSVGLLSPAHCAPSPCMLLPMKGFYSF